MPPSHHENIFLKWLVSAVKPNSGAVSRYKCSEPSEVLSKKTCVNKVSGRTEGTWACPNISLPRVPCDGPMPIWKPRPHLSGSPWPTSDWVWPIYRVTAKELSFFFINNDHRWRKKNFFLSWSSKKSYLLDDIKSRHSFLEMVDFNIVLCSSWRVWRLLWRQCRFLLHGEIISTNLNGRQCKCRNSLPPNPVD